MRIEGDFIKLIKFNVVKFVASGFYSIKIEVATTKVDVVVWW